MSNTPETSQPNSSDDIPETTLSVKDWRQLTKNWTIWVKGHTRLARGYTYEERRSRGANLFEIRDTFPDPEHLEFLSGIWSMPDEVLDRMIASFPTIPGEDRPIEVIVGQPFKPFQQADRLLDNVSDDNNEPVKRMLQVHFDLEGLAGFVFAMALFRREVFFMVDFALSSQEEYDKLRKLAVSFRWEGTESGWASNDLTTASDLQKRVLGMNCEERGEGLIMTNRLITAITMDGKELIPTLPTNLDLIKQEVELVFNHKN